MLLMMYQELQFIMYLPSVSIKFFPILFVQTMQSYVYTFSECWNDIADLRPTAMTVKNSLDKLLSSSTLTLPCHKDTGKSCQQQE